MNKKTKGYADIYYNIYGKKGGMMNRNVNYDKDN